MIQARKKWDPFWHRSNERYLSEVLRPSAMPTTVASTRASTGSLKIWTPAFWRLNSPVITATDARTPSRQPQWSLPRGLLRLNSNTLRGVWSECMGLARLLGFLFSPFSSPFSFLSYNNNIYGIYHLFIPTRIHIIHTVYRTVQLIFILFQIGSHKEKPNLTQKKYNNNNKLSWFIVPINPQLSPFILDLFPD